MKSLFVSLVIFQWIVIFGLAATYRYTELGDEFWGAVVLIAMGCFFLTVDILIATSIISLEFDSLTEKTIHKMNLRDDQLGGYIMLLLQEYDIETRERMQKDMKEFIDLRKRVEPHERKNLEWLYDQWALARNLDRHPEEQDTDEQQRDQVFDTWSEAWNKGD